MGDLVGENWKYITKVKFGQLQLTWAPKKNKKIKREKEKEKKKKKNWRTTASVAVRSREERKIEKNRQIKKKTEATWLQRFFFFFFLFSLFQNSFKLGPVGIFFFLLKFGAFFCSEFFKFFWGLKQVLNLLIGWAGLARGS